MILVEYIMDRKPRVYIRRDTSHIDSYLNDLVLYVHYSKVSIVVSQKVLPTCLIVSVVTLYS